MSARHAGLLGALAALWGASYLLIKYALEDLEPAVVVFARTAMAGAVLYGVVRLQGDEARAALRDVLRRPRASLGLGAIAVAAPFLLISFGELEVPSGLTAVLIAPSSIFVAMLAPALDPTERIDRRQAVGLVVGLVGVGLVVGVESIGSLAEFLGALAIVGASLSYALSTFMVKNQFAGTPSLVTSWVSVTGGAVLTLPAAIATAPTEMPGWRASMAVVVLGLAGTALAFVLFYVLIAETGAGRAALVGYLIPPIALAYGAALLDEPITIAALAGLVLVLVGVALASRGRSVAQEAPDLGAPLGVGDLEAQAPVGQGRHP